MTRRRSVVAVAECYGLLRAILNTAVADELIVRNRCTIKGEGVESTRERPVAAIAQPRVLVDAVGSGFRALTLAAAFVAPEDDARVFTGAKGAPIRRHSWWAKWAAATEAGRAKVSR